MPKPSKKPKPGIAEKKARVENAVEILGEALDGYEKAHPHWRIEVLVSLIRWSVKCLQHYIENPREKEITWEEPFVELRYSVEWDWPVSRASGDEHGSILYGNITDTNVADKEIAVETLSKIMTSAMNACAMADLTNWVRFAKRGNDHLPCLPVELADALKSIRAKGRRREAFEEIIRPFSIGAALVDFESMEMHERERVSPQVAAQLAKLPDSIDIPHIGIGGDVNGRKFDLSLIFQIHPLITDHVEEKAYHPVTVGLQMMPEVLDNEVTFENPAAWPRKDRSEFWEELFRALDKLTERLIPKEEFEDSVILTVNAQLKIPASQWKQGSQSDTMKVIADALSKGGELSEIQVRAEGDRGLKQEDHCPTCGCTHDRGFTQVVVPGHAPITLAGVLPDIVRCVHAAHEKGLPRLSTKDDNLLRRCGGYGSPCKAFYDLRQNAAYKVLFDTSRRGFIALRGFSRSES